MIATATQLRRAACLAVLLACAAPARTAQPARVITEAGCAPSPDVAALARVGALADAARARGQLPLALFDLDGTLLDPNPRTRAIFLDALAGDVSPAAAAARERITGFPLDRYRYRPEDTLARMDVPAELRPGLVEAWRRAFFTSRYLDRDAPIAGAPGFVSALHARGVAIVYLTGRNALDMRDGTVASLRAAGFPVDRQGAELWMKPDAALDDRAFKLGAFDRLAALGAVIGVFENEPGNLADMIGRFPGAQAVFVVTTHGDAAPPVPASASCVLDLVVPPGASR